MSNPREVGKILNAFVALWRRSQVQYLTASAEARDPDLKLDLATYALQRSRFVAELQGFILGLGQSLSDPGPGMGQEGTSGKAWANYRSPIVGRPEYQVLTQCEEDEEQMVKDCSDLLNRSDLPEYIRQVVERQCAEVKETPAHLAAVRKAFGFERV